ncbi:MAG: hypothetical protein ACI83B_000653 [Sediminicola sp.]|jgi:hypothetical protein
MMIDKKLEIPLTSTWLNDRDRFDIEARSTSVLRSFLKTISSKKQLIIADLGCGTGSNALFLSDKITGDIKWYLVEKEISLLSYAIKRFKEKYPNFVKVSNSEYKVTVNDSQLSFLFINNSIESFLNKEIELGAITSSALFDLFTENEFETLFQNLMIRKIPLYGVLNYRGVSLDPSSMLDNKFFNLFESHMSRELSKGTPMGKRTMDLINAIVTRHSKAKILVDNSDWNIPSYNKSFILDNFSFYKAAILDQLDSGSETVGFMKWLNYRYDQIQKELLSLTVYHNDFIIDFN